MGYEISTGDTSFTPLLFKMVSTDDYVTPMPGLDPLPVVTITKGTGAAFTPTAVVTELSGGWYKATNPVSATSETVYIYESGDAIGPLLLVATAAGAYGSELFSLVKVVKGIRVSSEVWEANVVDHLGEEGFGDVFYSSLYHWRTPNPDLPEFRGVNVNLAQTGFTPRALDTVADSALTLGDVLVAGYVGGVGDEAIVGTAYTKKTAATNTTVRTFALDDDTTPTSRT